MYKINSGFIRNNLTESTSERIYLITVMSTIHGFIQNIGTPKKLLTTN